MSLLTNKTDVMLWQDVIKEAEQACSVDLEQELEAYLVSLLIRYANKPELTKQIFATAFLKALHLRQQERHVLLQHVGDQCLLFAGLFPYAAKKKHVKIGYFVDLGRTAYTNLSGKDHDLYATLALQFVVLMDILQSIRQTQELLPLEAYEQWNEVGSQRALQILRQYTKALPKKF